MAGLIEKYFFYKKSGARVREYGMQCMCVYHCGALSKIARKRSSNQLLGAHFQSVCECVCVCVFVLVGVYNRV